MYRCPLKLEIDGMTMTQTQPTVFHSKDIFEKLEHEIAPFFEHYLTLFITTQIITKGFALDSLALRKVKRLVLRGVQNYVTNVIFGTLSVCKYLLRSKVYICCESILLVGWVNPKVGG